MSRDNLLHRLSQTVKRKIKYLAYHLVRNIAESSLFNWANTQRLTKSYKNRYPELFRVTQLYFLTKRFNPSILSFGCSHGEELHTLRFYFPKSNIVGVEKNHLMKMICTLRTSGLDVKVYRSVINIPGQRFFDLIFVLAVLQRTDDNGLEKRLFRFQEFDFWIDQLDKHLNSGGLLVIENTDFDFMDTVTSQYYKPLDFSGNQTSLNRILYNVESRQEITKKSVYRVFKKL